MCCNIHRLSAEQTHRQGGCMCCDVNRLNAKQSPSIITSSDVFMCLECACQVTHNIAFYFLTCFLIVYMVGHASRAEWSSSVNWHYPVDTKSAYVVSLYLIFSLLTITISSLAPKLKLAADCRQPAAISDSLLWRVGSTNRRTAAGPVGARAKPPKPASSPREARTGELA